MSILNELLEELMGVLWIETSIVMVIPCESKDPIYQVLL
jgi:hypothetical protein